MYRGQLTALARNMGIMHFADIVKFNYQRIKNKGRNDAFRAENPAVVLPPDYIMFESFQLDYRKYIEDGRKVAEWVAENLKTYKTLENCNILDWGCGPARIVRHLPEIVDNGCNFFGADYNEETIAWCRKNIENVNFSVNKINPPLNYEPEKFDALFGISIFTHLSEKNHYNWYNELMRVLKPSGIALLTTHGNAYMEIMTDTEKQKFTSGKLVDRANVKEGHRVFTAFQPEGFLHDLFSEKATILKHTKGTKQSWGIEQDTWIIRKK